VEYRFEPLSEANRNGVVDVFNYFIENSFAAYREIKVGYDMFDKFRAATFGNPAVAVKTEGGQVVGFAFMRPYHPAECFKRTAELTYFLLPEHTGKGLGSRILTDFEREAQKRGIDTLLASISSLNQQSIQFHLKHGFVECGRFREIGVKRGKTFDMVWMLKKLRQEKPAAALFPKSKAVSAGSQT